MFIKFSQNQISTISKYLSDLSKIVVGSIVINYFIMSSNNVISFGAFFVASVVALFLIGFGVMINK